MNIKKFELPADADAAAFIKGGAGRVNLPAEAVPEKTPPGTAKVKIRRPEKEKPAPAKARAEAHPWEEIPEEATQTYVVDLPAKLHCKLKWLGGMTWGTTMRKIVVNALEVEAQRLLAAKGIGK